MKSAINEQIALYDTHFATGFPGRFYFLTFCKIVLKYFVFSKNNITLRIKIGSMGILNDTHEFPKPLHIEVYQTLYNY